MKNKKEGFTSRVGLFLLLVTFCLGTVQAQSSKITGYVKDQSGEPLIGVNVMEKGTTNGTVTDLNGFYSIVVKASNAVLKFSYIGYKNQEIPVAGKKRWVCNRLPQDNMRMKALRGRRLLLRFCC